MSDIVKIVEVEGWHVAVEGVGDPVGKILDLEAGSRLGYKRPRAFRQLVVALIKQGVLTGVYQRHRTWQRSQPNGGVKEESSTEYWLTKEQLLVASAKSTTPIAQQILEDMARVFVLVEERGGVAAITPVKSGSKTELEQRTEHLRQVNVLLSASFAQLEDLESKGIIDGITASAHRTELLKVHGGIDLTKAPMVTYEKVQPQQATVTMPGLPVTHASLEGPGGLPAKSITIKAQVSREGFLYAYELGDLLGTTSVIIGQLARGAGIYGKITPVKNEYGIMYNHEHGVEGNSRDNWLYSPKSEAILRELATRYLAKLPSKPRKDSTKRFALQVGKEWKDEQPLEPPTAAAN